MAYPVYRPPLALRLFAALLGLGALAFNVLLMLSDRAPGALRRIGGEAMRQLFARIDAQDRATEVLADPRLPEGDVIVHVAVWAVAVLLVGWALWTWIGLLVGAVAVLAGSLVVEALQSRLSDTRSVEASDVRANLAGVVLGTATVAVSYALYSGFRAVLRTGRRVSGP